MGNDDLGGERRIVKGLDVCGSGGVVGGGGSGHGGGWSKKEKITLSGEKHLIYAFDSTLT